MKVQISLLLSAAFVLAACDMKAARPHGPRKVAAPPAQQKVDECPAAEGKWSLEGNTEIEFGRQEGFLTLQHPDLAEKIVMDGKARKIKQNSADVSPEVTATCAKQTIQITYKFEGKSVAQSWNVDLEKDAIVITEKDGENKKYVQGTRVYSQPEVKAEPKTNEELRVENEAF